MAGVRATGARSGAKKGDRLLYRKLSPNFRGGGDRGRFATILKVMRALDLKLTARAG
jgi:DNA-binding phage protein